MRKYFYLIFCFFLFQSSSINPGTVTIIFNDDFIIDCEFSFIPFCYGDQEKCEITFISSNGRWERYYCKIPLPDIIRQHQVTSAILSVFKLQDTLSSTGSPFRLAINRLSEPMQDYYYERITAPGVPPPAHFISPIYAVSDSFSGNYLGWINFQIDSLVQGWLNQTYDNEGFLIRMYEEGDTTFSQRIIICQSSYSDSTKRPILRITGPELPDTIIRPLPTAIQSRIDNVVRSYFLSQNYPNPFNPTTTINYQVPKTGLVSLKVYDLLGREVSTLVNEVKPAGSFEVEFNCVNLSSGVYYYKLEADGRIFTKKLLLIK
jgi:hypothetical protein